MERRSTRRWTGPRHHPGGADTFNPLLAVIDASLAPSPATPGRQTLGYLVSNFYIDGKVMTDAGDLDGDGVAVILVEILANP
jgi:hypothetical protein